MNDKQQNTSLKHLNNPVFTHKYFSLDYLSLSQSTVLRNGKIIDFPSEVNASEDMNMAQLNPNDSDTKDSSDISSQLSEMKKNYERKINELHLEFSQLKDLMMAGIDKTSNDSQQTPFLSEPPKR